MKKARTSQALARVFFILKTIDGAGDSKKRLLCLDGLSKRRKKSNSLLPPGKACVRELPRLWQRKITASDGQFGEPIDLACDKPQEGKVEKMSEESFYAKGSLREGAGTRSVTEGARATKETLLLWQNGKCLYTWAPSTAIAVPLPLGGRLFCTIRL